MPKEHTPRLITMKHAADALTGFNMKIAVGITKGLGTMVCAYIFTILAIIGFPGLHATPTQYVQWISQTFIQLVALSVLAVGQTLLGKHAELQAEEQYHTTMKTFDDTEVMMAHLAQQDRQYDEATQKLLAALLSINESLSKRLDEALREIAALQSNEH